MTHLRQQGQRCGLLCSCRCYSPLVPSSPALCFFCANPHTSATWTCTIHPAHTPRELSPPLQGTSPPHVGIVQLLAGAGASLSAGDAAGATPLHRASGPAMVYALLSAGADISALDGEGDTPLHTAAREASAACQQAGAWGSPPGPSWQLPNQAAHGRPAAHLHLAMPDSCSLFCFP